jgi:DNA-binding Lrp family transcriptional regulator
MDDTRTQMDDTCPWMDDTITASFHESYDQARQPRDLGGPLITAIVLIQAEADAIPDAAQAIADLDGVTEVYSCAGDVDLIASVRVRRHEDLADLIPGRIGKVPGVLDTVTHIAFRSYSRAETESAFDIGVEGA